jgi:hypothetical protein
MGFWSRLFGGGNDDAPKGEYFLDDDAAKSMGNTDYMREVKTVRRTFPKVADGEEFEQVNRISSDTRRLADSRGVVTTSQTTKITRADVSTGNTPSYQAPSYQAPKEPSYQAPSYQAPSFQASSFQASAPAPAPAAEFKPTEVSEPPKAKEAAPRRPSDDNSMDMFRNMAKTIKR